MDFATSDREGAADTIAGPLFDNQEEDEDNCAEGTYDCSSCPIQDNCLRQQGEQGREPEPKKGAPVGRNKEKEARPHEQNALEESFHEAKTE